VLVATSVGSHPLAPAVDSLVAMSLWLRGAEPSFLLCDGALPACEACAYTEFSDPAEFVAQGPGRRLCRPCFARGERYYRPLPLPLHRYRDYVSEGEIAGLLGEANTMSLEECRTFEHEGLGLGEQVHAAMLRFFGKADLGSEPEALVLATARRYAAGALVAARVAERVLEHVDPEAVVCHHGIYVPQGVLGEVARRAGVRVVNWQPAYRDTTVIFSHGDTYHRTMISEPTEQWDFGLTEAEEQELMRYLAARRQGKGDWTWVTPEAALRIESQKHERLVGELGLDTSRPIAGLLTNVLWDAQLYYEGIAFPDMLDWLWCTLDFFRARPDRQLLVRIHPHEVKQGNRQPVGPEIERRYGELPPNITVVPHDHPYNTYSLMELCDVVLTYGTKTGVELVPVGIPVVVCGDAWIREKGLTHDISSREEYLELLERVHEFNRLDPETIARGRSYAYHYFFRRMIPLASLEPGSRIPPSMRITTIEDLAPGRDPGLDVICDGIISGEPFVLDGR